MVKLKNDIAKIKELLQRFASIPSATGNVVLDTIFDDTQNRYQVIAQGWENAKRIHSTLIHIDMKEDRVWLQHDSTDAEIAEELVRLGIPRERIVLGFLPETVRPHTDFAVN